MIELQDIKKSFGEKRILNGLGLRVREGETYVILGPSGVGKSVTLKIIIGLLQADSGVVSIDGRRLSAAHDVMDNRPGEFGYLFQSGALINWLNVYDNLALPLRHARVAENEIARRVKEKLAMVELDGVEKMMPDELSGGMKKRVSLARTIVTEPRIVLYDEPTTGLDPIVSDKINRLIVSIQSRIRATSVVVTHDMHNAMTVADRIGLIDEGRIIAEGTPEEMMNSTDERIRGFIFATTLKATS